MQIWQNYSDPNMEDALYENTTMRPLPKGLFLPPALFANTHLLLNKLRFAAELKNKTRRFLHAVSSYAKLSKIHFSAAYLWVLIVFPTKQPS